MIKNQILKKLNFSDKESLIYLTLLEYGRLSLSDIYKKSGINRMALYNLIPKLISRGLISQIKVNKRKFYLAENPQRLRLIFEQEKKDFEEDFKELEKTFLNNENKPLVKIKEGEQGIKETFEDVVISCKKGETFYRYSAKKEEQKKVYSKNYYKIRDQKKLERLVITSEEKAGRKKSKLERFVKKIPAEYDFFDDNIMQIIYADKVAFVDYDNNFSFIIESKKIAKFQKKVFKLLYKKLKE